MTTSVTHEISLERAGISRWKAVCSCGEHTSGGYLYKGYAENAGASHVRGKGGVPKW